MKLVLILSTLLTLISCTDGSSVNTEAQAQTLVIRTGTSFGMCIGYCLKDLEVSGSQLTFTKRSHNEPAKYPTRTCTRTLTEAKANELRALAQFNEFRKVASRLGCPDCADGGAEYVEIQVGDQQHRVTFEYGKTIPGFENLVSQLRTQRESFNTCE